MKPLRIVLRIVLLVCVAVGGMSVVPVLLADASDKPDTNKNSAKAHAALSESETAAILNQVARCWSIPAEAAGAKAARISVKVELDPSGALKGDPAVLSGSENTRLAQSAIRAVKRCSPFTLPAEKYGAWAEITINFDPSEMK